jgi:succinate dehydrogenase/fumarate reductase flavoprotein subunit
MHFCRIDTDILVLGSGLAGLRAALSAHTANPSLRIVIVSERCGPAGSSFANRNNCLGMQVCFSERDQEELIGDVLNLAAPGIVAPHLVSILAGDSLDRFEDLVELGIQFRQNPDTVWEKYPACFSPSSRRAVIFDNLEHAFERFKGRLASPNVVWLPGMHALALLQEGPEAPVVGALLLDLAHNSHVAVRASHTIMALGGPAPIFRFNVAGPGNPGYSYGFMREAGVKLCNTSFLQFMWSDVDTGAFFPVASLASPNWSIGSQKLTLPDTLAALASRRGAHCPCGYGLEDRGYDGFLADNLLDNGWVQIASASKVLRIAPMVHAGNGGAIIDEHGRTNVPHLYACGECASGMHGANRIGGGMVLAIQVFGHRAGVHAAGSSEGEASTSRNVFTQLVNNQIRNSRDSSADELKKSYPGHVLLRALSSCKSAGKGITCEAIDLWLPSRERLLALTYNAIVDHCSSLTEQMNQGSDFDHS